MNTREFNIFENDENKINVIEFSIGLKIIECILNDIDILLQDYTFSKEENEELNAYKDIINKIYQRYNNLFSTYRLINDRNSLEHKQNLSKDDESRLSTLNDLINSIFYHTKTLSSPCVLIPQLKKEIELKRELHVQEIRDIYLQIYLDYQRCFEIESIIQQKFVIPKWKNYLTKFSDQYKQGEHFAVLFHSGGGFVILPGMKDYSSKKSDHDSEHKTDFLSTSLITDKEMESGNTNVGIIVSIKNQTILAASGSDCGTREFTGKSVLDIKRNEKTGNNVRTFTPISKLGTPKYIEKQAMKASKLNTGEILNAGKWICPIYTEVVVDKEDFELEAIFFKTTGCDLNFKDYFVAKQMEMYYKKPLRIVNQSICRENAKLTPYTAEEIERFKKQLAFFSNTNNYTVFKQNPVLFKNLIKLYYHEVIERAEFKKEVKEKAQIICIRIIEYLNYLIKNNNLKDTEIITLDDILNIELKTEDFPPVKYTPMDNWGSSNIRQEDISEIVLDIPQDLENLVNKYLTTDVRVEKELEIG